jgi:hypothetical protein
MVWKRNFSGTKFWSPCIIYLRGGGGFFSARETSFSMLHCKKRFTSFPSPAETSLTTLPLGRNNSVMTLLFAPRESLVVTSRLGTRNSRTFFLRCKEEHDHGCLDIDPLLKGQCHEIFDFRIFMNQFPLSL